ncbi:MAG: formyltetrahydrofolate deformylase [Elusimicrobiota bacterium]
MDNNAVLLISCPDRRGLIALVTDFVYRNNGNIEHSDQHVDHSTETFFMRIEWALDGFNLSKEEIKKEFSKIADEYSMKWELYFTKESKKTAIFVSRDLHCLYELLYRYESEQFNTDIPLIISNYKKASRIAGKYGIDFYYTPTDGRQEKEYEEKQLRLLDKYGIDTVVLARYMKILSPRFVNEYPYNIINIHHSFLPAFVGAKPYEQAHSRGVKLIGATSHYVTKKLDDGPIIEQDVTRISHRDSVKDLKIKGEDLEKLVLSRALNWHLDRKVLIYGDEERKKTVIFD